MTSRKSLIGLILLGLIGFSLTGCAGEKDQTVYRPAVQKLIEKANDYKNAGNPAAATCRLEAASEISPGTFEVVYNLGILYTEQKNWQPAIDALSKAKEISPENANAVYSLGAAYEELGNQYSIAERAAADGQQQEPSLDETAPAPVMSATDAHAKAVESYQKAVENYELFKKVAPKTDPARGDVDELIQTLQGRIAAPAEPVAPPAY